MYEEVFRDEWVILRHMIYTYIPNHLHCQPSKQKLTL